MDSVVETLFLPLEREDFSKRALFINARYHPDLVEFGGCHLLQHFKPYAAELETRGFKVQPDVASLNQEGVGTYDLVLIWLPKNMIEARFFLAEGIKALAEGGSILCAAGNKAGAGRLIKLFKEFGFCDVYSSSANKCRVVRAVKSANLSSQVIEDSLEAGSKQKILEDTYTSQPGIFGWDKKDKGSALLASYLPDGMSGHVADFGCGYGYLSHEITERSDEVKSLMCIDADYRALECCSKNIKVAETAWLDLTKPLPDGSKYDFIVMNPPFHEGKKTDSDIGEAFIQTAYAALKKRGQLWMVANAHLPYEHVLSGLFTCTEKLAEKDGFKVYKAEK